MGQIVDFSPANHYDKSSSRRELPILNNSGGFRRCGTDMKDKNEILRSKKLYLFDMDGTLYLGDRLYEFPRRFWIPSGQRAANTCS